MAPKRRAAPSTRAAPTPKPSKLGKAHNLTAALESEIRSAWSLFCAPLPSTSSSSNKPKSKTPASTSTSDIDPKKLDDTIIQTSDVRRVLVALNAPPTSADELGEILDALDPEREGYVAFEMFFAVAALKVRDRNAGAESDEEDGGHDDEQMDEDDVPKSGKGKGRASAPVRSAARREEVREAFALFTRGEGEVITLAHLRRVARELREEVDDKVLRDMIREANGGIVGGGDGEGGEKATGKVVVGLSEFEDVMRRAGVFG